MSRLAILSLTFSVVYLGNVCLGDEPKSTQTSIPQKHVRIGAVAYSPSAVTIFEGLKKYLNKNGLAADYVLYSNYDAMVGALKRGEIEIAWNTPLAHAKYHALCGNSQTLVMRDIDKGIRSVLVVRANSGIKSLGDLPGKTMVLASKYSAEGRILPVHYLKKQGVDLSKMTILDLDGKRDFRGNPCSSPQHVLKALQEGKADAGLLPESLWKRARIAESKNASPQLKSIWVSPQFNHCVFTASSSFDKSLGKRFTELMTKMDPNDPTTRDVMRLEGTRQWILGDQEGFADLVEAIREKSK